MVGQGSKLRSASLPDPQGVKAPIGPLHTPTPIPASPPQPSYCHWTHEKNTEIEQLVHCHTAY